MKFLGGIFRYVLNINTIWGAMILITFFACLWQHFTPEPTYIPAYYFSEGENTLLIDLEDEDATDYTYIASRSGDSLTLELDESALPQGETGPTILGTRKASEDFFRILWQLKGVHGTYSIVVNEEKPVAGKLVNLRTMSDAAIYYAEVGFEIALGLVAVMVLFLGLMKVGEDAGIVQIVAKVFYPIIRFLFPDVPKEHPANGAILMNVTTTVLGLGNAATPFGLKAMKELEDLNPHPGVATDSMVMLLGYNTAGFALLPTTLLAVRSSAGCSDPFAIIGTCMFAGGVSTITAIIAVKVYGMLPFFSKEAAAAEYAAEQAKNGSGKSKDQ